jgi:hypothetical protein
MQNACLGIRKNKFENGVTFEKVKENRAKSKRYSLHDCFTGTIRKDRVCLEATEKIALPVFIAGNGPLPVERHERGSKDFRHVLQILQ